MIVRDSVSGYSLTVYRLIVSRSTRGIIVVVRGLIVTICGLILDLETVISANDAIEVLSKDGFSDSISLVIDIGDNAFNISVKSRNVKG